MSQEKVYNQRVLIRPNAFSDINNYIPWATELKLLLISYSNEEENSHLVGPFNFKSIDQYNLIQKNIYIDQWIILQKQCNSLGILPPIFGINHSRKPK